MIAGDARDALSQRLLPGCCQRLFINYPEPPHQTDLETATRSANEKPGEGEQEDVQSENKEPDTHLLTPSFLKEACGGVLEQGGTLTICTDSEEYGEFLARTFRKPELAAVFEDALTKKKQKPDAKIGNARLRKEPPLLAQCGASYKDDEGVSYFQRLKESESSSKGKEAAQFFLCLRRL